MKNKIWWIGLIIVVVALVVWATQGAKANQIKVGFIGPLTGSGAVYGEEGRNAIMLAVDEINRAGGIGGKQFAVDVQDGQCEGGATANAWQKLTSAEGIKVIFGGNCSTESATIGPLTAQAHVMALSALTSISNVPNEGEWFFRNSPLNSYYAQAAGKYAYQTGLRTVVLFTEQKDYGVDFANNFKQSFTALGGKVIEETFAPGATDFRTTLESLKAKPFEGVLLATQGPQTMGLIVNQMRDLGLQNKTVILSAGFSAPVFLQTTNHYIPPHYWGIVPYVDTTATSTAAFLAAYDAAYHKQISFHPFYIAATYDMVYRLKGALGACNNDINNVECLRKQFQLTSMWDGAAGRITFNPAHQPLSPLGRITIVNGAEVDVPVNL